MHGSGIVIFVISLVLGIFAAQGIVWAIIILWLRRRTRAAQAQLVVDLEAETLLRRPEKGNYRGATAPGYPFVKNRGVIALSMRRLVFITLTGKTIEIPVADIRAVRESKVFNASVVGGKVHLVVVTAAGEIAFFVSDNAAWIGAITKARQEAARF
jgi:hypothetical protein